MLVGKVLRKENDKEGGIMSTGTSKISGATYTVLKCELEGKGEIHAKCKLCSDKNNGVPKKTNVVGFVAFSADYGGPKRHLPRHN